jgi:hypothetical protein
MKKISLLLIVLSITVSKSFCQETSVSDSSKEKMAKREAALKEVQRYHAITDKVDSITRKELKKGIINDTVLFSFCFGDSPGKVHTKKAALLRKGDAVADTSRKTTTYTFPAESTIKGISWKINFKYANEALAEVRLSSFPSINNIITGKSPTSSGIKNELQKKYGACTLIDSVARGKDNMNYDYYWIKNNLKIHLTGSKSKTSQVPEIIMLNYSDTRYDKITIEDE